MDISKMHAAYSSASSKEELAEAVREAASRFLVDPSDDNWLKLALEATGISTKACIDVSGGLEKFIARTEEIKAADMVMNGKHKQQ